MRAPDVMLPLNLCKSLIYTIRPSVCTARCFLWCADAFVTVPPHNAVTKNTALHMSLYKRDVTASKPSRIAGNNPESTSEKPSSKPMTVIIKNIKAADPIPEAGIEEAVELMRAGKLYRYNVPDAASSVVSQVEVEVAAYTGHKYCVALNSCGSALFLALKCAGVQPGDKVLTNAFTFAAVPSAIEHAGGVATYVETDWNFCIDVSDLETKLNQHPDAKFLMAMMKQLAAFKFYLNSRQLELMKTCDLEGDWPWIWASFLRLSRFPLFSPFPTLQTSMYGPH